MTPTRDYWRFGPIERFVLAFALWVQWTLLGLVTLLVLGEHGDPDPSFGSDFEWFFWIVTAGLFVGLLFFPVVRWLPDGYRAAKRTVRRYT